MVIGYTTGVYDMFHIGHLNILRRAKEQCDYLIVGVSTDELVQHDKNKTPIIPFENRCAIVEAIKYVDKVVPQEDKNKFGAWERLKFDKMFVGSDWKGTDAWNKFEEQLKPYGVEIVYLDHTDGISSSILRDRLNKDADGNDKGTLEWWFTKDLKSMGLNIAHATLCHWMELAAEKLELLDEPLHQEIITSGNFHSDESTLQVLDVPVGTKKDE